MRTKKPKLYFTDLPFEKALHPDVWHVWNRPQFKQRTPEWYEARKKGITASSVAATLMQNEDSCRLWIDTYRHQDGFDFTIKENQTCAKNEQTLDFILSKCGLGKKFEGNEYTRWGQKYEPIVTTIYSQLHQIDVLEFGLIFHPEIPFLAASPDGITTGGRMLEIKCPPCRRIKPYPPIYYHQQILMQLICTNLKECDYMDAHFVEYIDVDGWEDEARLWETERPDAKHHLYGIMLTYEYDDDEPSDLESDDERDDAEERDDTKEQDDAEGQDDADIDAVAATTSSNGNPGPRLKHIYAPPDVVKVDDFFRWSQKVQCEYEKLDRSLTATYYKLHDYHICRVHTNSEWFEKNFPIMQDIWNKVEYGKTEEGQEMLKKIMLDKEEKKMSKRQAKKKVEKELVEMAMFVDVDVSNTFKSKQKQPYIHDECLL
jgi:hypothetical protein